MSSLARCGHVRGTSLRLLVWRFAAYALLRLSTMDPAVVVCPGLRPQAPSGRILVGLL